MSKKRGAGEGSITQRKDGTNIKIVQELMGHSSMSVTADVYSHVLVEHKVTEMKKLDNMFVSNSDD